MVGGGGGQLLRGFRAPDHILDIWRHFLAAIFGKLPILLNHLYYLKRLLSTVIYIENHIPNIISYMIVKGSVNFPGIMIRMR